MLQIKAGRGRQMFVCDALLYEFALDRIHDRFEPVVSTQLLVDVVQVVP